ncbi:heterokaryon incompatibility protein-domain-containing protein [Rhypophila decipiens]|uniref:Heterokaryon incompatibility protein-domain-containing protein n=1 Tax=Rhypophila decipiens TaxID=261697 RepID=A0AAN6YAJ1_9PEZI|nr:heterokaryon incompatibility protein-domain-containing protein [Rhypophila decipiens]
MEARPNDSDYAELKSRTVLAGLNQALVALSKDNTQRLISRAAEKMRNRQEDAAAILNRLRELNPAVADRFQPKQTALDALAVRMIFPHDVLSSNDALDVPSYIIVSYCWHYPDWPLVPAARAQPLAPGWEISRAMVDAVMGLRQSPLEGVWLDKLCINQGDEEEKQRHIAAMDLIYQSARRMAILLEDVQLSEAETNAGVTYAKFYQDLSDEIMNRGLEGQAKSDFMDEYFPSMEREYRSAGLGHLIDGVKDFAMNILNGRWYSRAWCAHESRVAPHQRINNPLLLCFGHDGRVLTFEFRFVFYLAIYLHNQEPEPSAEDGVASAFTLLDTMVNPNPETLSQLRFRIQSLYGVEDPGGSAMQHVSSILAFGCFKKGDLMSIALNTAGIPLSFSGDVSGVEDVIWMFSVLVMASNDLYPLLLTDKSMSHKLRITDPKDPTRKLISWVPIINQGIADDRVPEMSPGTITAVAGDYIELDLLVFKASPTNASPEAQKAASEILEENQVEALAGEIAQAADAGTKRNRELMSATMRAVGRERAGPMAVFNKVWLAHALDCGLEWMLRFPDAMQQDTSDPSWIHGPMGESKDARFANTAEAVLRHFFQSASPEEYQYQCSEHLGTMIRSLTTLFDPRLPFFTAAPRRLPLGNGDHAFVASTSNRAYVAVPVAVAHLPAHFKREWNIEPFDPLAEPENLPDDHLPDLTKVYPRDAKAEDVFPVLTSDYEDRRAPRDDSRASWRLRRRGDIFGFTRGKAWTAPVKEEDFPRDGEVIYLRRQRVYGAEDYDWGAIRAAWPKLKLEPETTTEEGQAA